MISDVLGQVSEQLVVVFNNSANIGRLIADRLLTKLTLRWYSVDVTDWSAIEIVRSLATNNDRQLLLSSEDYCRLLKPLIRPSPTHRRVIKDNLRPLLISFDRSWYLVLPHKHAANLNHQIPF